MRRSRSRLAARVPGVAVRDELGVERSLNLPVVDRVYGQGIVRPPSLLREVVRLEPGEIEGAIVVGLDRLRRRACRRQRERHCKAHRPETRRSAHGCPAV